MLRSIRIMSNMYCEYILTKFIILVKLSILSPPSEIFCLTNRVFGDLSIPRGRIAGSGVKNIC